MFGILCLFVACIKSQRWKRGFLLTYDWFGDRALADGRLMAQLYYRGMMEENGKPKVGRSARLLGVSAIADRRRLG